MGGHGRPGQTTGGGYCAILLALMVSPLAVIAVPQKPPSEREAERIAYEKCGPDGTVDWDANSEYPPPHCNRNGWNGKRYVEPKDAKR